MSENDTASVYDYARAFSIPEGKVQAAMYQAGGDGAKAIEILKANLKAKGDPAFTKRVPKGGPKLEEKPVLAAIGRPVEPVNPPAQAPRTMGASPKNDQDAMLRIDELESGNENDTASVYDYARAFSIPEGKVQAAMYQAGGDGARAIEILKAVLQAKGNPAFSKKINEPQKPSREQVKNLMQVLSKASFASPASTINPRLDQETDLKYGGIKILQNYLGDPLVDQEELKRKIAELEEQKNPKKVTGHKGFRAKTPADFGID